MRFFIISLTLALFPRLSFCQDPQWNRPRYIAEIEDKKENFILSGALYNVTDSSVILTCSTCKSSETQNFRVEVPYFKIDNITIRRNIHLINWMAAGGVSGVAALLFTYFNYKNNPLELPVLYPYYLSGIGILGSVPFIIFGLIRSAVSVNKVFLKKDREIFINQKEIFKKYCFIQ